jgi:hypothetical protein
MGRAKMVGGGNCGARTEIVPPSAQGEPKPARVTMDEIYEILVLVVESLGGVK